MTERVTRRSFLRTGLASLLAVRSVLPGELSDNHDSSTVLQVRLEGRGSDLGSECVSFGLPLPPGLLTNSKRVRITDESGQEVTAAVRSLEPWRTGGRQGSIRALLIQCK